MIPYSLHNVLLPISPRERFTRCQLLLIIWNPTQSNWQGMKLTSCRFLFIIQIVNRILMGSEGKNDNSLFCYNCSIKMKRIFGWQELLFLLVQVFRWKLCKTQDCANPSAWLESSKSRPLQAAFLHRKEFYIRALNSFNPISLNISFGKLLEISFSIEVPVLWNEIDYATIAYRLFTRNNIVRCIT